MSAPLHYEDRPLGRIDVEAALAKASAGEDSEK